MRQIGLQTHISAGLAIYYIRILIDHKDMCLWPTFYNTWCLL